MQSIYDFINSRDVREYLREIYYQFTAPEAAFVVYWSKLPVKNKLSAWEEIIRSMPDCTVQGSERTDRPEITSFHAFLREYMELLKQGITNSSSRVFEYMCFPIPTPFKRGDILTYYETNEISGRGDVREDEYDLIDSWNRPFVLSHINAWNVHEYKEGFCAWGWHGVLTVEMYGVYKAADWVMRPAGTYIRDARGSLERAGRLPVLYTDLEYYRKPLKGPERQLQAYSSYECGDIREDLLINSCFAIRMEEYCREVREDCIIYCPDEILQKTGLKSDDEGKEK